MTDGCPHINKAWCMLDPKYHKPDSKEIETYCSNTDNYINCQIYEKYANMECGACS